MIAKLKAIFSQDFAEEHADESKYQLACAALMTEVAAIDNHFDSAEEAALIRAISEQFKLSNTDAEALLSDAKVAREDATSLHQFTKLVNDHFDESEKFALLQSMWRVASSDGNLDKYEEHIIRRCADLLYVGHSEFIRAKLSAKP